MGIAELFKKSAKADDEHQVDSVKEALKEENALLKAVQFAMPDPYYARDMDYNIILWPDSIAKLTGYSAEEAKRLKCYQMFKACVCPPKADCPTQGCIKTKQFLKDVAVDVYHKNGSTIHSLVSNAGIYDEKGNPIGAVEVVKNNTDIQKSMNSIGQLIKDMDSSLGDLAGVSQKVSGISDNLSEHASESLSNIKNGDKACVSVNEKVGHSSSHAGRVQTNMQTINGSMKSSVEKISVLKSKSETIFKVIAVIQRIAFETNLLAINASIEAAHAGEVGKGFGVVADGVKKLAVDSSQSAESIKGTIQEIIELVKETTNSLNTTEKDIEAGTNSIAELLKFVNEIDGAVKTLVEIMSNIQRGASATSQLSGEQNTSVGEVNGISRNLSDISHNLTHEFDRVVKAVQRQNMG